MATRDDDSGPRRFPATHASAILRMQSEDPEHRATGRRQIAEVYWKPVYAYVRLRWRMTASEAEDVTQEFFLRCFDRDTFASYDPAQARFRTFLRVCLDRFVTDRHRRQTAAKRGGPLPAFDFAAAERELADRSDASTDPEQLFERAWVRHVMSLTVARLREDLTARAKAQHLHIFERFHLDEAAEPPTYAQVASDLGISVTDVTNRLSYARRQFQSTAVAILREITLDEDEFRNEMRALFGDDARRPAREP
jgi:RNA polymerase sigma factor (sigma-70 family)